MFARVLGALCGVATATNSAGGHFRTEQGGLDLKWQLQDRAVTFTLRANATSYVALAFGTGMAKTDVVLCWVEHGEAHAVDAWSVNHSRPLPDETFGGSNDVKALSGSVEGDAMTVTFTRLLDTGDAFDAALPSDAPFDVAFAWADGTAGEVVYHRKQHGHWQLDLSKANGVPASIFGGEMQGVGSRHLVANMTVGSLATLNIADGSGAAGTAGFPHTSVTSFADFGDGRPVVLLSGLERNIINQDADERCSLEIHDIDMINQGMEAMMVPRTTLMGHLKQIPKSSDEHKIARAKYLVAHPDSSMWIDFNDFHLYFLELKDVYWVGGFGGQHYIGWVSPSDYFKASPSRWGTEFVWHASLPEPPLEDLVV